MGGVVRLCDLQGRHGIGNSDSHNGWIRFRAAPSAARVARRLSHVFDPIRNRSGQQFQSSGNGVTIQNPSPYTNNSAQLLISEQLVVQPNDWFGIMPIFLYQRTKDGNPADGWNQWESFGARPIVFFSKHLSLALKQGLIIQESRKNWPVRWVAAQIHAGAANRSGTQVFQPAGATCLHHLCRLVERLSRSGRRGAISESNQWTVLWRADRNMVVEVWAAGALEAGSRPCANYSMAIDGAIRMIVLPVEPEVFERVDT